jgi:orotate phosphoribosyltransferase
VKNLQLTAVGGGTGNANVLLNAKKAAGQRLRTGPAGLPHRSLLASLGLGYNDTKIKDPPGRLGLRQRLHDPGVALRRVQDQGRAPVALLLQRRPVRRRRQAGPSGGILCTRLLASGLQFDMLFGPAYKGITLAAAVAMELARLGRNCPLPTTARKPRTTARAAPWSARRCRAGADHRRRDLGRHLGARVHRHDPAAGATPCAVAIALDRQEKASEGGKDTPWSAVQYVRRTLGLAVRHCDPGRPAAVSAALRPAELASTAAGAGYRDTYGV